jgi:type I restriction enzyme M protein
LAKHSETGEGLEEANRLYLVVSKFADIDLHPSRIDNIQIWLSIPG